MPEIRNEIEIEASAHRVWAQFTDFQNYPDWNPFIVRAMGQTRMGTELNIVIVTPLGRELRFSPRVVRLTQNSHLTWTSGMFIPGLFDREISFDVEPLGEGRCRFVHTGRFRGILAPFRSKVISDLERGYQRMNEALKARAESGA